MIHIVGLGGIGFWLAVGLSRLVPSSNLRCWDDDTLTGGHGALRLPSSAPSTKKTDLLTGFLLISMGSEPPTMMSERFTGRRHIDKDDLVIDCTDMPLRNRRAMWTWTRKNHARLLRASYDGRSSMVVVSTGLPLCGSEQGGYREVPSLALSLAAGGIAAESVRRYLEHPISHFEVNLSIGEAFR